MSTDIGRDGRLGDPKRSLCGTSVCFTNACTTSPDLFYTANLRTKILDFRGFDSSRILILRGGHFESSNLSRDHLSREIGRMTA